MVESDDNMFDHDDGSDGFCISDSGANCDFWGEENDDFEEVTNIPEKESYAVLKEEDVHKRQEDAISEVCSVLSVPREEASLLLRHFKWSVNDVNEAWFADEDNVRKAVGLVGDQVLEIANLNEVNCGICFDSFSFDSVKSLACCHPFCATCWRGYISTSINDGPGCLSLKCPIPNCGAAVGQDFITEFASDAEKKKYQLFLFRSYVEEKKDVKWCPAPDCGSAVEYVIGSRSYDVTCNCCHSFCWNCIQEVHRPVDCKTVEKWQKKNNDESENTTWILAYTKPCPKCKRPIEKNQGCNHMTCGKPCGYQFCWICLQDWMKHEGSNCNRYVQKKGEALMNEDEVKRQKARIMLHRYMHYYERWAANHKSREKARSDLEKMQSGLLKVISKVNGKNEQELSFIVDAWHQIIECRRVLKWTYAYGYYLPEDEYTKKQFFEYLQGEAEAGLERLHRCAEKELEDYYKDGHCPCIDFTEFRTKLIHLTKVTGTYFENLVTALENGLVDVNSEGSSGKSKRQKR